ncbi:MAG: ferritin-like domain-containing protein [Gemmatimonadales bacterium]
MKNDRTILEGLDPELMEQVVSRRAAVGRSSALAGALAIASMPVAFGLLAKRAFAQGGLPQGIIDVLNFALTLEYLEEEFYVTGVGTAGLIPGADLPIFEQIRKHETAHVALLQSVLGASAVAKPTFDFTAGGAFDPFNVYGEFQALSQGFEDTGVRAYKGQAAALMSDNTVLTTALRIHSVEGRHASEVRRLRGQKGWITGNQTDVPALAAIYAGEEAANGAATSAAAAEAFDEPLTMAQVLAIADPFIV